jgi:hypothetical protein
MTRTVRPKAMVSILGAAALGVTLAMTACGGDDDGDGGDSSNGGSTTAGGGTNSGPTGGTTTAGGSQGFANQRKNTAPSAR